MSRNTRNQKPKEDLKFNIKHSQNFISSSEVARATVELADLNPTDTIIEIGAGKGALTTYLSKKARKVIAVEKDPDLFQTLIKNFEDQYNVDFVNGDILKYKFPSNESYKVFGNIPFNITSQIVKKILNSENPPKQSTFIIQKEAAERLLGSDSKNGYENLFSLRYKPFFQSEIIKEYKMTDFTPTPKVEIVLLNILRRDVYVIEEHQKISYLDFVTFAFNKWQKSLKYVLKDIFSYNQMKILSKDQKIDFSLKPSQISFNQWIILFKAYLKYVPNEKKIKLHNSYVSHDKKQKSFHKSHRSSSVFRK